MKHKVHPRPCPDWPARFQKRAAGSFADCDLLCPSCRGRGCRLGRQEVDEGTTIKDVLCRSCRGSGLLVPAADPPDDIEAVLAADDAGGAWLDWIGHTGDGMAWPRPWCWTLDRRRFPIRCDVYLADEDVIAFMENRNVVIGLFRIQASSRRHLEAVFEMACGLAAPLPQFVLPRTGR